MVGECTNAVPGFGSGTLTLQLLSQALVILGNVENRAKTLEHLSPGLSMSIGIRGTSTDFWDRIEETKTSRGSRLAATRPIMSTLLLADMY